MVRSDGTTSRNDFSSTCMGRKRNKGSEEETPGDESQWTQDYTAEPEEDARRETSLKKKTPRMRGFVVKVW